MQILTIAVEPTSVLHVRDAADNLLYEKKPDAADPAKLVDDLEKPVTITLHSPGSKAFAKANAAKNNRYMDRIKRKGKSDLTADQTAAENAQFFADCTASMQHIEIGDLQGEALYKAVYSNYSIGFIAEQVNKQLGDWANFTSGSTKG